MSSITVRVTITNDASWSYWPINIDREVLLLAAEQVAMRPWRDIDTPRKIGPLFTR